MSRVVRPVVGTEAQGVRLLVAVLGAVEYWPEGPWVSHAPKRLVMDGEGRGYSVDVDGVTVQRLVVLSCRCACAELTVFRDGVEVRRIVGPVG